MMRACSFDYQSDRHCSKTSELVFKGVSRLITSQIDTAPKQPCSSSGRASSLITSQIDTAPKQRREHPKLGHVFDYQSDRHCSKTIGPKSPLQRTVKTDWQAVSTLNKMQVNKPFTFMLILIVVVPVLQQENSRFLKKHLLENGLKIIFR